MYGILHSKTRWTTSEGRLPLGWIPVAVGSTATLEAVAEPVYVLQVKRGRKATSSALSVGVDVLMYVPFV